VLHRRTKVLIAVAGVLVVAVVLRAVSPVLVKRYVNRQLADMGEYSGTIADLDLALLRGGYTLHDLTIVKTAAGGETSRCRRWTSHSSGGRCSAGAQSAKQ
jgi:hypothetical protein